MAPHPTLAKPGRPSEHIGVSASTLLLDAQRILPIDPDRAAALAARAVEAGAGGDAMVLLLATARRRAGDAPGALSVAAALAARRPGLWGVHFEHGMALSAVGETCDAITALRRACAIKPDAMLANHALWTLATLVGEAEAAARPPIAALTAPAAIAAVRAFLGDEPDARLRLAGRFGLDPNDAAAACLIAEIGTAPDCGDAVIHLLRDALRRAPGHRPATVRLAQALHGRGDDAAALAALESLPPECRRGAAVLALSGSVLMALGRLGNALVAFGSTAAAAPGDERAHLAHGHALRAIGDRPAAIAAYRTALRHAPACGEAYWSLADLKSAVLTAADVGAMTVLLERDEMDPLARSYAAFALGRALEDGGRHPEAFRHYRAANLLRQAIEPFDLATHERLVRRTIEACDAGFFAARGGWGDRSDSPIFVLGMPRSGSTLVEQILASHSAVESASELPDLTAVARAWVGEEHYPEGLGALSAETLGRAGADYLARTRTRRQTDRRYFVDKFPGNVLHLPLLHLALPNARIIDVRRDPLDCCVSLFAQSFARGQAYSYDLATLGGYYASYVRLVGHFDAVLPGRILRVRYEDVVDDPEGQTRRMLAHVGLAMEPACLRFFERAGAVRTASSEQVRRPPYRCSIGRWRRFAPALGPLIDALRNGGVATDAPGR